MRKGMSQTLTLIVAASVLMMTALTVIFMVQGGLQDVFGSSNTQSCYNSIKSTCKYSESGTTHQLPGSCERVDVSGNVQYQTPQGDSAEASISGDRYVCEG